ncbi:MAG: sulfurtransferase [Gammaproteobacteria bacterium]|nr:sulfurtransferase [Gammaproteobacteria bacterium]
MNNQHPLVSADWLHENMNNENLVVLDASMDKVLGKEPIVYDSFYCILNAQKCDIESNFHNVGSTQPNTMPTVEQFTFEAQRLGVNTNSVIIIYDNQGIYSAPRAWWMFKSMGHKNVYVLDGGLPEWLDKGYKTTAHYRSKPIGDFVGNYIAGTVCNSEVVLNGIDDESTTIVDARANARFVGSAAEPYQGSRSGHIPKSVNIPFLDLLQGYRFRPPKDIREIFEKQTTVGRQLICSCGSGITACVVMLAADVIGIQNLCLYDGSWSEWGSDPKLPIEKSRNMPVKKNNDN